MASPGDQPSPASRILGVLGVLAYLGIGYFYLASGLMVPGPWLFILWAVWLAGAGLVIVAFRRRPGMTIMVAAAAAVFWYVFVQLGSWLLGWTA
jgi:hypothetical protein